jgi:hypothetical protein
MGMSRKRFFRVVNNPRHIPGVHNYCDRWCERCPLPLRCSVFAVGEVEDRHGPFEKKPHEKKDELLWPRLYGLRAAAEELLAKHADHAGVAPATNPKFRSPREETGPSPLGAAATRYMDFAHEFVEANQRILPARVPAPDGPDVTPAECYDVIRWYHTLMPVKLARALHRDELDEELESDPDFKDMPKDSDGSAKVVLLSIERTILAWTGLYLHVPELHETALRAMLTLARLRRGVAKAFPGARPFVRPGFDTLRYPNQECQK